MAASIGARLTPAAQEARDEGARGSRGVSGSEAWQEAIARSLGETASARARSGAVAVEAQRSAIEDPSAASERNEEIERRTSEAAARGEALSVSQRIQQRLSEHATHSVERQSQGHTHERRAGWGEAGVERLSGQAPGAPRGGAEPQRGSEPAAPRANQPAAQEAPVAHGQRREQARTAPRGVQWHAARGDSSATGGRPASSLQSAQAGASLEASNASPGGRDAFARLAGFADRSRASLDAGRGVKQEGGFPRGGGSQRPFELEEQVDPAKTLSRVSKGLADVIRRGGGEMTVRLEPEALGAVRVDVRIDGQTVDARVQATTEVAQALLSGRLRELRTALESRGLEVGRLTVAREPSEDAAGMQPHAGGDGRQESSGGGGRAWTSGPLTRGFEAGMAGEPGGEHTGDQQDGGATEGGGDPRVGASGVREDQADAESEAGSESSVVQGDGMPVERRRMDVRLNTVA